MTHHAASRSSLRVARACGVAWILAAMTGLAAAADGSAPAKSAKAPDASGKLLDLGAGFDLKTVETHATGVEHGGTPDAPALVIRTSDKTRWPGVTIPAPGGAWDLSAYECIALDVRNVDKHDIDVFVRVDNPGADGGSHCMTERIGTQPDQRVTLTMPIKRGSKSTFKLVGMNGFPQGLYASGGIEPGNIVALTIFVDVPGDHRFEVSNIRAFGKYQEPTWMHMGEKEFFPFIDAFGQFKHKEWPGKVHAPEDLKARRDEEATQLATVPAPKEWDSWGGWANGPKLKATGHFRTQKHQGKWWLVDPDGALFFSTGITCVGTASAVTAIDERESYFESLPTGKDDPLARFLFDGGKSWGGGFYAGKSPKMFNFTAANLQRKYGADWEKTYPELVHKRLRSWGLNTIGNWSDGGICAMHRTPYTATFWYECPRMKDNAVGFPDVFDPAFGPSIDKGLAQFVASTFEDPWCIGYFLDNEMPWGGEDSLARYALASPAKQAAKQKLGTWLRERHATIADLNTAWGSSWDSWEAFAADAAGNPTTTTAKQDLIDFTGLAAETYFRTAREAMRKRAPQKLYLGCRCVGGSANVVAPAVTYCDVISYNRYCASVRDIRLPDGLDAPVMIGEFHFGGLDRGPFWAGLFSAENQEDRGRKLTAYLKSALDNPQIVGAHWFQYGDEAATGRIDGENAQIGFVDICDTPYAETITAAQASAATMYRYRLDAH